MDRNERSFCVHVCLCEGRMMLKKAELAREGDCGCLKSGMKRDGDY